MIKTKLKSRDPGKLPMMKDDTKVELMRLLDQLTTFFYVLNDSRMPLTIFRRLMWTFKYGVCIYSALAFATTGMILTGVLHDIQGGAALGQHALTLMNNASSNLTTSRTMFLVYTFLFSWARPIRDGLKPLVQAMILDFKLGKRALPVESLCQAGLPDQDSFSHRCEFRWFARSFFTFSSDTESALFAIYEWLVFKFLLGTSSTLESLEADIDLYLKQMKNLKKAQIAKPAATLHQVVLNLLRKDNVDDPTRFFGNALSEAQYNEAESKPWWKAGIYRFHGVLLTYFGHHIRQADILVEHGHDYLAKAQVATPCIMQDTYLKGVSCFAAARETRKSHYAKLGEICRSKIKKWICKGNPNVKHYEALLDAEAFAWQRKHSAAMKSFELAICCLVVEVINKI